MPDYVYRWPASHLGPAEMALLFQARECTQPRRPIVALVAEAVRQVYGLKAQQQAAKEEAC